MNAAEKTKYPSVAKPEPFRQDKGFLRLKRLAKELEKISGDGAEVGGTGHTLLKFRGSPLARLAERKTIAKEELDAAEDIYSAYMALTSEMWIKPQKMERTDKTNGLYENYREVESVIRYRAWVKHWSDRKRRGDPTLEIVIDAVVEERPLREIERAHCLKSGRSPQVIGSALRDYAARAGWAPKGLTEKWKAAAESNFQLRAV